MMFHMGNGVDILTTTGTDSYSKPIQVNQPCAIVGWGIDSGDLPGNITVDIEYCTAINRRADGVLAYYSITASGEKPFLVHEPPLALINDGTYNDGFDITDLATGSQRPTHEGLDTPEDNAGRGDRGHGANGFAVRAAEYYRV